MSIKLSISGIRGKFDELMPNRVVKFAEAFSTYIDGGDVIVGADARPSGTFITEAVFAGLIAAGSNVHDYGIIPTPILHWIIKNSEYKGGISITAGHNSFDWNSLIFLNSEGSYLSHVEGEEFFNLFHSMNFSKQPFNKLGQYRCSDDYVDKYFETLQLKDSFSKPLKFVIDCSNGFDSWVVEKLSRALGIQGVAIFCRGDGFMQKDPEPTIANAGYLSTFVRETHCDGGFLLNSDASRILIVDETGTPLSEELTFPIFAQMIWKRIKEAILSPITPLQN
jgi:phosphomannomutase